jgi:hypothetical protein
MRYFLLLAGLVFTGNYASAEKANWGIGTDGGEYCFPTDANGKVIRGSRPIDDKYCGARHNIGKGTDGKPYSFPTKRDGSFLKRRDGSENLKLGTKAYKWGKALDGSIGCFPVGASGKILRGTPAVSDDNCL